MKARKRVEERERERGEREQWNKSGRRNGKRRERVSNRMSTGE